MWRNIESEGQIDSTTQADTQLANEAVRLSRTIPRPQEKQSSKQAELPSVTLFDLPLKNSSNAPQDAFSEAAKAESQAASSFDSAKEVKSLRQSSRTQAELSEKNLADKHLVLSTGDVLVHALDRTSLYMPNGDRLYLDKRGAFGLDTLQAVEIESKNGLTKVIYKNGEQIEFDRQGNLSVTRGEKSQIIGRSPAPELQTSDPTESRPPSFKAEADFVDQALGLYPQADKNDDGVFSKKEIESALFNPDMSKKERKLLAALRENYDELKHLYNDKGLENGVSLRDIAEFASLERYKRYQLRAARDAENLYSSADGFQSLDADGSGFISKQELQETLDKSDLSFRERIAVTHLLDNVKEIQKVSNDEFGFENNGISIDDLRQYRKSILESKETQLLREIRRGMLDLGQKPIQRRLERNGP